MVESVQRTSEILVSEQLVLMDIEAADGPAGCGYSSK